MWNSLTFSIAFICQAFAQTDMVKETRKYIYGAIFDTVLLHGDMKEVKNGQKIQWSFIDRAHKTLISFHHVGSETPTMSSYYQHRCTYYPTNGSLELQRLEISDSGVYQLNVEGYYSDSPEKLYSYLIFLEVEGIQFLHKRILLSSVIAVVSTMMSFAAICFIIFFCIEKYKGPKQQMWLTIAFLFIEMKCYMCLLISCILCALDTDISLAFRVISGMVFCIILGLTGYIVFLYLHPHREDIGSFLLRKREFELHNAAVCA
ncbi:uncharacterized protein LOC109916691 [Rhincodon typus]|uniref:uncharacterized protein LOC109916691 n=1 Tax=Rhincodon typus TaxID=259920 RepID=UPI00203014C1|nr:uncharacterized protein LOC109916691 [Rhincodon typus]